MKRRPLLRIMAFGLAICISASLPFPAQADRAEKTNSLSECVAKADIIIIGIVDAKDDVGKIGVATIDVLGQPLKGKVPLEKLTVSDPYFRSSYKLRSSEGPPILQKQEAYIFFLADAPDPQNRVYHLFNSHDGFIHVDEPVVVEICNQLQKAK